MTTVVSNFLAAACAILLVFLLLKYIKWRKVVKRINLIPGSKHVWPFGVCLPYLSAKEEDYMQIYQKISDDYAKTNNAPLLRAWLFNNPYVGLIKARSAEILLKSTSEITKSDDYKLLRPWLGLGLLTSTGSKWHAHRKMLTPSFHFHILESFVSVFNEQSKILVDQLARHAGKGSFDICPFISRCTLDIICETAMGKSVNAQTQAESEYVNSVATLADIIFKKYVYIWRTVPFIYFFFPDKRREEKCTKIIHDFTNGVIRERQAERAKQQSAPSISSGSNDDSVLGVKKRMAFLDTLLEAIQNGQGYLTNEEIREEVDTFMFEGHDTTASALVSAIMTLALDQEVQTKAYEEIVSIFGENDRPVEMADMANLKYLEAVVKEVLRLYPPVPFYGRKLKEDLVVDGYTIPKEMGAVINVRAVHRDPEIYKNPNDFDPSRFLKENSDPAKHPYSFIAFSAGPRNCIGQKFAMMEEKVLLTYILKNFKISGKWTEKEAKMSLALVSRPIKGLQVTLTKR